MNKAELVAALAAKLNIAAFDDVSNNGIQVDSRKNDIRKLCTGVDATLPFFKAAVDAGADMVICHHGISWGDSLKRITGLNYELVSFLVEHNLALFACHLPLDAHAELGNNAGICDALGIEDRKPFGLYHGQYIGFSGRLPLPLQRDRFADEIRARVSPNIHVMPFGKDTITTVGIVSGGAAAEVTDAIDLGLDAYITGEADLVSYNTCLQCGMNMFAAGHYATERFGVRSVGAWLNSEFGIDHEFIDFDLPY